MKSAELTITCVAPSESTMPRALDRADAAADAAGLLGADLPHQRLVGAPLHRGVEIDQLHLGERAEPVHPRLPVVGGQREALALDQLHHLAVTEVDGGYEHRVRDRESGMGVGSRE